MKLWLGSLIFVIVASADVRAQDSAPEPPKLGQPADFSQIVGVFQIKAAVQPALVAVEEPITLTVTITGQAVTPYLPKRELLHVIPDELLRDFFVEPRDAETNDAIWTFRYTLRPKHQNVKLVPSLKLVYYAPRSRRYQAAYSDAMPITVQPRQESVPAVSGIKVIKAPASFFDLADATLAPRGPELFFSPYQEIALVTLPPVICFVGAAGWRRWQRRAAGQNRQRRRDIAKLTASLEIDPNDAAATVRLLTDYLRLRVGYPAQAATPADIERWLKRRGVHREVRQRWRDFMQTCDFAQIAPPEGNAVVPQALTAVPALIQALENEPCLAGR